jgi:sporulation protein YlmC with PRC-barrel domain
MLKKYAATALIGSALLAPVAFAETPAATTTTPAQMNTTNASYQGDWRASKVVGIKVYNDNNENVGSINDLLTDKSGTIKAVVIGVGGFLGMGEHLVAVPFDKMKFVDQPVVSASTSTTTSPPGAAPANRPASTTTTGAASSTTTTTTTTSTKSEWYPDHAVFNATKDELKAMPEFKYSS